LVEILFCLAFSGSYLAECIDNPGDNGNRRVRSYQFDNFFNSLKLFLLTEIYRAPCLGLIDNAALLCWECAVELSSQRGVHCLEMVIVKVRGSSADKVWDLDSLRAAVGSWPITIVDRRNWVGRC
jgi:hypothetical protein